jgi:hypothetical protein
MASMRSNHGTGMEEFLLQCAELVIMDPLPMDPWEDGIKATHKFISVGVRKQAIKVVQLSEGVARQGGSRP